MISMTWPYQNWQHLLSAGIKPWANDEMTSEEADELLRQCRNHIETVLWSVLLAANAEAQP